MLENEEPELLKDVLATALSREDPRARIGTIFGTAGSDILKQLPTNYSRVDEYADWVVEYCVNSRWSYDPSLMQSLLQSLLKEGVERGTDALGIILERVKKEVDPNPDIFDSRWVLARQPFVNRRPLRRTLKEFIQTNDRSLLVIKGPGAGRTYTTQLFDYLSERSTAQLHFVPVEIAKQTAASYDISAFAADLLSPMGVDVPPPTTGSHAAAICRMILRSVMSRPGLWIFVLDGFGQKDLQPEVQNLVTLLAQKIPSGDYRKKMRLILIDAPAPTDLLPATIATEEIPSPTVTSDDLVDCLAELNQQMKKTGRSRLEEAALPVTAAKLLQDAPNGEKERLRFIYNNLVALHERLAAG